MDIVYGLFAGNHLCQHTVSLSLRLVYVDPLLGCYREFFVFIAVFLVRGNIAHLIDK